MLKERILHVSPTVMTTWSYANTHEIYNNLYS